MDLAKACFALFGKRKMMDESTYFGLGMAAMWIGAIVVVLAISPFMNWLNGYGFVWFFE